LDGHFILDRKLAEQGQYPAINPLKSISRVMNKIVSREHLVAAQQIREFMARYEENSELIQIGAYKRGTNQEIDQAISYYPKIQAFLKQGISEYHSLEDSITQMQKLLNGGI
jgi:flagellum-specific ATP synthase